MSQSDNSPTVHAFPFFSILTLIFITLKLTHVINWSWWFVLIPLWAPLAVFFVVVLVALIFVALREWLSTKG